MAKKLLKKSIKLHKTLNVVMGRSAVCDGWQARFLIWIEKISNRVDLEINKNLYLR